MRFKMKYLERLYRAFLLNTFPALKLRIRKLCRRGSHSPHKKCVINIYHSLGYLSRRQTDDIYLTFSQKIGFDISCKLPLNNLHMSKPVLLKKKCPFPSPLPTPLTHTHKQKKKKKKYSQHAHR